MVKGQKSIHANEAFASRNSIDPHHREFSFITGSGLDSVDSEISIAVNAELLVDLLLGVVLGASNIVFVWASKTHTIADAEQAGQVAHMSHLLPVISDRILDDCLLGASHHLNDTGM
ncbi:hypothetical protein OAE67_00045 [bacterium]|nr:hypothetical protein [bacterium]|tara:strand:+ start:121 stop:471 length:351 start_codon:yes stop_codon:yes gene_type:complete